MTWPSSIHQGNTSPRNLLKHMRNTETAWKKPQNKKERKMFIYVGSLFNSVFLCVVYVTILTQINFFMLLLNNSINQLITFYLCWSWKYVSYNSYHYLCYAHVIAGYWKICKIQMQMYRSIIIIHALDSDNCPAFPTNLALVILTCITE